MGEAKKLDNSEKISWILLMSQFMCYFVGEESPAILADGVMILTRGYR